MTGINVVGRYAPSPTGAQHLGNLRTALVCWLQARLAGGRLILRMDDLDQARVQPGSAAQIQRDLSWLGLHQDGEMVVQSRRDALYSAAFEKLKKQGRVFPCRCSRRDIQQALSAPDNNAPGAVYPGTCRPRADTPASPVDPDSGQPVAWRFLVSDSELEFTDQVLGPQHANLATWPGDFVVRRKDGITAYQLASVVDDGELGVTDVVRGADLADSSARQLVLFHALGYSPPRFWHVPLMSDSQGDKLSKRDGSDSLQLLQARGLGPGQVIGQLAASLGLVNDDNPLSARDLANRIGSTQQLEQRLSSR